MLAMTVTVQKLLLHSLSRARRPNRKWQPQFAVLSDILIHIRYAPALQHSYAARRHDKLGSTLRRSQKLDVHRGIV